jgi:hypothetical protein
VEQESVLRGLQLDQASLSHTLHSFQKSLSLSPSEVQSQREELARSRAECLQLAAAAEDPKLQSRFG